MRRSTGQTRARSMRRLSIRWVALLACCFATADGVTQVAVFDAQQMASNAASWASNAASWAKQMLQWKQQFDQWEQQYFTMLNVVKVGPAFLNTSQLQRRDVNHGMDQECPEQAGALAQQQNEFCRLLVQIDNQRYNLLVDLNRQINQRHQEMQAILARRITQAVSSDLGGLRAFDAEMQAFEANLNQDVTNARAALDQYATFAQAIREQQARLARQALRSANVTGLSGLIGVAVQGAVLKGALETAKHL